MYYTTSPETGRGARAAVSISLSLRATRHAPRPARRRATHTAHADARATAHRHSKSMCLPCVVEHANGDALTHIWSYHNVNVTLLTACSHADTLIKPAGATHTGRTVVCARGLT